MVETSTSADRRQCADGLGGGAGGGVGCTPVILTMHHSNSFGEGRAMRKILLSASSPRQEVWRDAPIVPRPIVDRALRRPRRRSTTYVPMRQAFQSLSGAASAHHQNPMGRRSPPAAGAGAGRMLIRPPLTVALGAPAARSLFASRHLSSMAGRRRPSRRREGWLDGSPSFLRRVRDNREGIARFV